MFKKLALAAVLAVAASSSFAAPTDYYGGLDLGVTKADGLDGKKTSFGAFAGYGFNQYVAVEAGYRQLGTWGLGYGIELKAKQSHVSVVGSLPVTPQFDIYGRLGYNKVRGFVELGNLRGSDDSDGALYGIGVSYTFTPVIFGRFEVQKPSSDTKNYGLSLVVKF